MKKNKKKKNLFFDSHATRKKSKKIDRCLKQVKVIQFPIEPIIWFKHAHKHL